jgi:hypothetical protein
MAFQRRPQGGGNKPALSVQLSVKQGKGWIKGPSFGFWPNDQGGPAFKGNLKEDKLAEVLEFIGNAHEAGLVVAMAMFDNSEQKPAGFKQAGGFQKKQGFSPSGAQRKPNPFKQQQPEEDDEQQGPEF